MDSRTDADVYAEHANELARFATGITAGGTLARSRIDALRRFFMRRLGPLACALLLISTAGCGTTDDVGSSADDVESSAFDGVLGLWNAAGTGDVADVYAPDAKVFEIESVVARGIEEIGAASAASRDADYQGERVAAPTIVFDTGTGDRYAVAPVESHDIEGSDSALDVVVLEWVGDEVVSHWWLPVPAAGGDFRVEDDPDAVEIARRMMTAWNSGDNDAALDVYASDVRVYWFGSSEPEGLEDLISNVEAARSIGNRYEDVATPTVLTAGTSGRVFTVNVVNVTGPGHPNGSLVIAVSELANDKVIAWMVFFVEDLPPGRSEGAS